MPATKSGRGSASFTFDESQFNYLAGYVEGMSGKVRTNAYIGAVIDYAHGELSPRFDMFMDGLAQAAPNKFHHVYEWPTRFQNYKETTGVPQFRLWRHRIKGRGANKVASFYFLPSVRPVPVNPILTTPGPSGKSVREGVHIFTWKAPMMEYGLPVVVNPVIAKYLAFVTRPNQSGGSAQNSNKDDKQGITFSKGPVRFFAGGGNFTGVFTNAYVGWWSQVAQRLFDREMAPTLARDLVRRGVIGGYKRRGKSFGINAQAYSAGRQAAIAKLAQNQKDYTIGARTRIRAKADWSGQ